MEAGALSGALSNQKEGGKTAGNVFALQPGQNQGLQNDYLSNTKAMQNTYTPGTEGYAQATKDIQGNSMLGGLFGQGGTLDQTIQQQKDQSNQGYALTPEDRTAYGEASGDIARQFGESDQSLAQSLSDRGLSNSGAAGAAFSGSHGNKMEQLAKAQTDIAQKRYQSNLQRLGQTQNFLTQLGGQGQNAVQNQFGNIQTGDAAKRNAASMANNNIMGLMSANQQQANEGLAQEQQTQHGSTLSNAVNGGIQTSMQMGQMGAGMFGGGGMGTKPKTAGGM